MKPLRWHDPNQVEVGQVWDYVGEDGPMTMIVTEVRDTQTPWGLRRNASCYVVTSEMWDGEMDGKVISYSEQNMRSNFRMVS